MSDVAEQRAQLRRLVGWTVIGALCIAALTAIVAIVGDDFDDTDGYVIATSVGFAICTALAASGASLRFRGDAQLRGLGAVTVVLAAITFLLLVLALWREWDDEDIWRWWGCFGLAALAASHASLVSGARRDTDSSTVSTLAVVSICLALFDTMTGILVVAEVTDDVDPAVGQLLAVVLVLLVLTSILQPILRRLQPTTPGRTAQPRASLAAEVLASADRIEELNADPARLAPEIRRECERLRELARMYERQ